MNKKLALRKQGTLKRVAAMVIAAVLIIGTVVGAYKGGSSKVNAAYATPRLIVTGCDIAGGSVKAGADFDMTLHLKNESTSTKLTNIRLKLSSEENQIVTVSGSDTIYVDELDKEEEYDVKVKMRAKNDLEQQNYTVTVSYAYENSWQESFEDTASVVVPVVQESKLCISEKKLSKNEVAIDGKTSLSFKVNNMGLDKLRNVTVEFSGDTITEIDYFAGTIEPGASNSVDMTITPDKVGDSDLIIKVNYEDAAGKKNTYEDKMSLVVKEAEPEETASGAGSAASENAQGGIPVVPIAGAAAVIVFIVIIVNVVKKHNMKKYE